MYQMIYIHVICIHSYVLVAAKDVMLLIKIASNLYQVHNRIYRNRIFCLIIQKRSFL